MKARLTKLFTLLAILTLGITNVWGALTAHTPGVYEKTTDKGGYGATIVTVSERDYEVYGFSYNSSGAKPQILWAGTSTNNASASQVLCSNLSTTSQEIAGWISMSTAGKSSTYSMPSSTEFAASSVGSSGLYQMKMQGHSFTIKVKGYDQFSFLGNDNNADKSKGKYLQVTINGTDVTTGVSTSTNVRRYDLNATIESTIVITGLGGSNEHIDAFSLRLPEAPTCSTEISTQPSGATIAVGDANPELSIVATNVASYAWKESSDGTSYDGSSALATTADYTPSVNDAVQTKYYYCEVTSSCDGAAVTKSDIVTVNVVGTISYYTVTLNPAGGTIVDATGWTLNAGNYEKEVAEGTVLTLPTFTKTDRAFKTWRKAGPADVASPVTVDGDLALTAIWTATVENVLYSWEGAEGGAIETGGTVTGSADNLINQPSAGYYCLKIDGNNSYSGNLVTITLAGTEKVKTGDKIKYWGFYNKSSNANARPKMRDANSPNASIFDDPNNLPNLYSGGDPAERTFTVPTGINTSAVQLTRSQTGSNTWISKLQIIREAQVEEGDLLTVTLNYNDGVTPNATIQVASGQVVAKPADPTWAHHRFNEWQLAGSAYDFSSAVTTDITLVANWTQLYTISFANGGGSGDAPAAIPDKAQGETFTVPANTFTAPSATQEFDKWNDGTNDYNPDDTYTVGTANVVLTAQWKTAVAKYTVIFKDGSTELDTKLFDVGTNPSDAGVDKTKPLSTFAAWQKEGVDIALDDASWASVAANAEITLTARWAKAYASNADFEAYIIANPGEKDDADKAEAYVKSLNYALSSKTNTTFDANTGSNNGAYAGLKIKNAGTTLSWNVAAGKVVELKAGVMVANGSLSINGGAATTIDGGSTGSGDNFKIHYFYSAAEALYVFTTSNSSAEVIKAITMRDPYQVTFDANGGDDVASLNGTPSVTLPLPIKGTESFIGWYDGETKVGEAGESYTPTANITLKAHWEAVSTDARLASITFSSDAGTLSPAFDPEVTNYTYTMPYGTASVPTITGATSVSTKAQEPQVVSQASAWGETAVIRGVAESSDTKAYNITMLRAPKDGVCLVWADVPADNTLTYNATNSKFYAESDVTLQNSNVKGKDGSAPSGKKFQSNGFLKIALNEGTFLEGDIVALNVTYGTANVMHVFKAQAATSTDVIGEAAGNTEVGLNKVAITEDAATLWLVRGGDFTNWNPHVDYVAVYRPMNPMLTAITINGEDGVINENAKTVAVELQPGYDLAALTISTTIVSNTPEADVVKTVTSNSGNWVIGDNTYRLTDKDGDYTEYTVTLSEGEVKHIVSFNTHGGSTIDPVEVVDGQKLAAAPTDPTKEDYIFQGWAETEDGSIVDVTSFTISADKEFHAVWVADGAIKLLDGATVNHTNFITGVTADETVEFKGNEVHYAKFSGTVSGVNGVKDLTRVIAYNATTNKTKIQISAHNNSTSGRNILVKGLVEGASAAVDLATIALGNKEDKVSEWIEFDNATNRTIYIMVSSSAGDVYFTQVKVIESGETLMKQAGEAGYALNLNKGRFFGLASTDLAFEGLNARLSGDYTALNSGYAKLNATSMSFTVASAVTLSVTTNNSKTYYVTKDAAGTDNETAKTGVSEFDLTAGTWYITAGSAEIQITNIAFSAPKCEQPTVVDMENIGLCEGDAFTALTVSASVTDGGTLHYQWYKHPTAGDDVAVGTDAASYTPDADGQYYVVVTNKLTGFADNTKTSNTVAVEHFTSAEITTAPLNQRATVGNNVTLNVAATGKNVAYKWYTCDEDGTNEVALDPAKTGTSIEVAVTAGLLQWYKVKVTSDCGNAEAMAKVEEFVPATPANVTESIVWDWTSSAWPASGEVAFSNTAESAPYELLADAAAIVPNNDAFRSDMLYGKGQWVWRSGNKFFQGTHIKFNSTVAGIVRVYFRGTGSGKNVQVSINGTIAGSGDAFKWSDYVEVPAGEVEIIGEGIGGNTGYTRIQKIEFFALGHSRDVTPGDLGTLCLPNACIARGVDVYELAGKEATYGKIVFADLEPDDLLDAGQAYIFQVNEATARFYYAPGESVDAPLNNTALKGNLGSTITFQPNSPEAENVYFVKDHALWSAKETGVHIGQYRAYLQMDAVSNLANQSPAPGRRYIMLGTNGQNQAQGIDDVQDDVRSTKMLIDGRLFILRGEKIYDATGRLVK